MVGPLKIVVLMGGTSEEREVSLASGVQVARALILRGHEVHCVDTTRGVMSSSEINRLVEEGVRPEPPPPGSIDLIETGDTTALTRAPEFEGTDIIFPALHGGTGEDGTLQGLLELTGIPFAGSDKLGCTLAMDKEVSKNRFRTAGVPTPDWISGSASFEQIEAALGLPVIVKPPSGGSTLGLTLAHDRSEFTAAVDEALRYEDRVLFEAYVKGRELTVAVVGDEPLPVGEVIPEHVLFDYECKYQPGLAEEIFPADITSELSTHVQDLALKVHRCLFLRDFSRVDFILDESGQPWCLEANALPGLTAQSLFPRAASAAGISFPELCERIVQVALGRSSLTGTSSEPSG